jgi:V/A-type H+-transporting ATPase subunit A
MARDLLHRGNGVAQMMKVVGEEGTSMEDFLAHLKAEYLDAVYLQQDAFDPVDSATSADRQRHVFGVLAGILRAGFGFKEKEEARRFMHGLTQTTKDWNRIAMDAPEFKETEERLRRMVEEAGRRA